MPHQTPPGGPYVRLPGAESVILSIQNREKLFLHLRLQYSAHINILKMIPKVKIVTIWFSIESTLKPNG